MDPFKKIDFSEKMEIAKELYELMDDWKAANDAITTYFDKNRGNETLEEILTKVVLIDRLYWTRLNEPISVARHILKCERRKEWLDKGDNHMVEYIMKWEDRDGKNIKIKSFASKYAHFSNKSKFPIYDKYAVDALKHISQKLGEKRRSYEEYSDFIRRVEMLRDKLDSSFEELDKYLWLYGQTLWIERGKEKEVNREVREKYNENKEKFRELLIR